MSNGHTKRKNMISKMKNFDGLINRPDRAEKRISEFENRSVEIIQTKTQKRKKE